MARIAESLAWENSGGLPPAFSAPAREADKAVFGGALLHHPIDRAFTRARSGRDRYANISRPSQLALERAPAPRARCLVGFREEGARLT